MVQAERHEQEKKRHRRLACWFKPSGMLEKKKREIAMMHLKHCLLDVRQVCMNGIIPVAIKLIKEFVRHGHRDFVLDNYVVECYINTDVHDSLLLLDNMDQVKLRVAMVFDALHSMLSH